MVGMEIDCRDEQLKGQITEKKEAKSGANPGR
jgi:hypothetical protein